LKIFSLYRNSCQGMMDTELLIPTMGGQIFTESVKYPINIIYHVNSRIDYLRVAAGQTWS